MNAANRGRERPNVMRGALSLLKEVIMRLRSAEMGTEDFRVATIAGIESFWLAVEVDPGDAIWQEPIQDLIRKQLRDSGVPLTDRVEQLDLPNVAILSVFPSATLIFGKGQGIYLVGITIAVNQRVRLPRDNSIERLVITWETQMYGIGFHQNYVYTLSEGVKSRLARFIEAYRQANESDASYENVAKS